MKKRNTLIGLVVLGVVGSGLVYAGNKHQGENGHGFRGHHGGQKIERMVHKLKHHLDLTTEQSASIDAIMDAEKQRRAEQGNPRKALGQQMLSLDPVSPEYQGEIDALADKVAEIARAKVQNHGRLYKQVSEVLTKQQREEVLSKIRDRMENSKHRHDDV